jgi:hypothetical protein
MTRQFASLKLHRLSAPHEILTWKACASYNKDQLEGALQPFLLAWTTKINTQQSINHTIHDSLDWAKFAAIHHTHINVAVLICVVNAYTKKFSWPSYWSMLYGTQSLQVNFSSGAVDCRFEFGVMTLWFGRLDPHNFCCVDFCWSPQWWKM